MRFFSSVDSNLTLEEMAQERSCSVEEEALRTFWVASFQVMGLEEGWRKSFWSWLRKPIYRGKEVVSKT